jgi:hypothetical protein
MGTLIGMAVNPPIRAAFACHQCWMLLGGSNAMAIAVTQPWTNPLTFYIHAYEDATSIQGKPDQQHGLTQWHVVPVFG